MDHGSYGGAVRTSDGALVGLVRAGQRQCCTGRHPAMRPESYRSCLSYGSRRPNQTTGALKGCHTHEVQRGCAAKRPGGVYENYGINPMNQSRVRAQPRAAPRCGSSARAGWPPPMSSNWNRKRRRPAKGAPSTRADCKQNNLGGTKWTMMKHLTLH
jgi:hypothetical protein